MSVIVLSRPDDYDGQRADNNHRRYDFADLEPTIDPAEGEAPHYIESSVYVYLRLDDEGKEWIIDGATVDGYALDSPERSYDSYNSECPCSDKSKCSAAVDKALKEARDPNGFELMLMLATAMGYTVTQIDNP